MWYHFLMAGFAARAPAQVVTWQEEEMSAIIAMVSLTALAGFVTWAALYSEKHPVEKDRARDHAA